MQMNVIWIQFCDVQLYYHKILLQVIYVYSTDIWWWREEFFATDKSATLSLSDSPTHSLSDLCKMHHLSDLYMKCIICLTYTWNASFVRPIHEMRHLSDPSFVRPTVCPTYTQNASFFRPIQKMHHLSYL